MKIRTRLIILFVMTILGLTLMVFSMVRSLNTINRYNDLIQQGRTFQASLYKFSDATRFLLSGDIYTQARQRWDNERSSFVIIADRFLKNPVFDELLTTEDEQRKRENALNLLDMVDGNLSETEAALSKVKNSGTVQLPGLLPAQYRDNDYHIFKAIQECRNLLVFLGIPLKTRPWSSCWKPRKRWKSSRGS